MGTDVNGGVVGVYGKDGSVRAQMGIEDKGGLVAVWGKGYAEKENFASAVMGINDQTGVVSVSSHEVPIGAIMGVLEHGGQVVVRGNAATMDISEFGGNVGVYGKGSKESRALMTVNEYGNGAVSTWDKNGYRLATLK